MFLSSRTVFISLSTGVSQQGRRQFLKNNTRAWVDTTKDIFVAVNDRKLNQKQYRKILQLKSGFLGKHTWPEANKIN